MVDRIEKLAYKSNEKKAELVAKNTMPIFNDRSMHGKTLGLIIF